MENVGNKHVGQQEKSSESLFVVLSHAYVVGGVSIKQVRAIGIHLKRLGGELAKDSG